MPVYFGSSNALPTTLSAGRKCCIFLKEHEQKAASSAIERSSAAERLWFNPWHFVKRFSGSSRWERPWHETLERSYQSEQTIWNEMDQ